MSSPEQHENADLKKYLWILIKSKCAKYINIILYIINYWNIRTSHVQLELLVIQDMLKKMSSPEHVLKIT